MSQEKLLTKSAPASPGVSPNFAGVWKNQLGSVATIAVQGAAISGSYKSAVSSGGQPISGDLRGFINGDLIAFTVNWPSAAITAWVGQLTAEPGEEVIRTLWQMTTNIPDDEEATGLWASICAGADEFTR